MHLCCCQGFGINKVLHNFYMKQRIKKLEKEALALEVKPEERDWLRKQAINYSEHFLNNIDDLPAYVVTKDKGAGLLKEKIKDKGIGINSALRFVYENVDTPGLNPASGGHLGYIPGGGIFLSSLGDYIAAITNRYSGIFYASPGAVRMENMLVSWMGELVGYPREQLGGSLLSGGSTANLTAIVTARDAHKVKAKNVENTAVYLTQQVHHSVDKALRIAGLEDCVKRHISMDKSYKMNTKELEEAISADKKAGITPWLIIASAGTTDLGAVDPLEEIGAIARKHKLWFHVDAAYGGFFLLTKQGKEKLKGIELSDSVVMDPHKGLFIPYGIGAVIVKNKSNLSNSLQYLANYMQDTVRSNEELSPADMSPELTRHFRGLRLWLPLMVHGLKPFKAALQEKLLLTQYFYKEIQKIGFEVGPEPELSVASYRYLPKNADINEFNERLAKEVQEDGRVFISSTNFNNIFVLRFACLSFRTHIKTVDLLIRILKEKVKLLEKEFSKQKAVHN